MTDEPTLTPPEDADDLLAAEYVLGLLSGPDWRDARDRALVDRDFALRVEAWEARFAPLNDEFDTIAPPNLLPQIEARLFPTPARPRPRWGWGLAFAASLVLALGLTVVTQVPQRGPVPALVAELVDESGALFVQVAYDAANAQLAVTRLGPDAEAGRDFELWVIDESGAPRSLGLLRAELTEIAVALAPGNVLAVSLEPEGGSPEPAPTGPVLAAAPLGAT